MNLRKIIFWSHLVVGIAVGIIVLSMSMTGTLLSFERQITVWAERDVREVVPPSPESQPLDPEAILQRFKEQHPDENPTELALFSNAQNTVQISAGREKRFYLNPYTGKILGEGSPRVRKFFTFVTEWHRWFALEKEWKERGKAVTGAGAFGFFLLLLSGLYLWIPKQKTVQALKAIALFNFRLTGKPWHWNWHNVIGLWISPIILLITVTGIIMAFPWANNLLFKVAHTEPPPVRRNEGGGEQRGKNQSVEIQNLDTKWIAVQNQVPNWQSIRLRLPNSEKEPLNFNIDTGNGTRPDTRSQLRMNAATGEILKYEPYESLSKGRQWRSWVKALHIGEGFGLFGQITAAIAAIGSALLVCTGFSLALYRFGLLKKRA
ncbi:MAG: PepSY-associated TM helix domain-containing protein [Verrucomicrobiota bacterium]